MEKTHNTCGAIIIQNDLNRLQKKAEDVHVPLDLYSQFYREKYRQVDIFQTLIGYNDGTIVTVNWMRNVKTFDLK